MLDEGSDNSGPAYFLIMALFVQACPGEPALSCKDSLMTIDGDAKKLLAFMDSHYIDGSIEVSRGWGHVGATIVDAALQRRQNYERTVKPRVVSLVAAWPDSETTTGFRRRLSTGKLPEVITWYSPNRLAQIEDMTRVFEDQQSTLSRNSVGSSLMTSSGRFFARP